MKLKSSFFDNSKHDSTVTAISWSNNDEIFSCGDDHVLMKWNFILNEVTKVAQLPDDFFPISLHWFPKKGTSARKPGSDLLLASSVDGKFHFLNKNGRFDRSIDAHQGAVLVALWSYDGAGLLTAGEDGQVKIWSRSGMLRSTVVTGDVPVYTAAWGPDSNHILVAQGRTLLLKPLTPNSKPIRWRAHEGVILKVAWNQRNNLIVSAGEDCRYKVWDAFGHALYSSSPHDHPITSVAWAPLGDLFAVSSFNTLRLCDRLGWSHSLEKVRTGTIYELAWSPDGTQLAGACGNGQLIFAHVVDRRAEWKNYEVDLISREVLVVRNVLNDTVEKLEFSDRVAQMALGFDHLVVTTSTQCFIYSTSNWNTPIIVQLKDFSANHIALTSRSFSLVERGNLNVYGYDGKLLWSPKLPGMEMETIDSTCMSLSPDTLAVIDQSDAKILHLIDLTSNRQTVALPPIHHGQDILQVALSQTGSSADRMIAFLDQTRDVYLASMRTRDNRRPGKLGSMVSCIAWGTDAPLLAGVRDAILTVWCCPQALYFDSQLLRRTTFSRDLSDMGKGVTLVSFCGNIVTLRRSDGSLVNQSIPPYLAGLLRLVSDDKWADVMRLCRFVNDDLLWSCLACLASLRKELTTAEEAFAAINELDKVAFIQHIKSLPLQPVRSAHLALLSGNVAEAEGVLLSNGLIFRAIMLMIATYNWPRALDLAIKHRTHIDTVLYKRKLYLEAFDKMETNEKFISCSREIELDPEAIDDKIKKALAKEKEII